MADGKFSITGRLAQANTPVTGRMQRSSKAIAKGKVAYSTTLYLSCTRGAKRQWPWWKLLGLCCGSAACGALALLVWLLWDQWNPSCGQRGSFQGANRRGLRALEDIWSRSPQRSPVRLWRKKELRQDRKKFWGTRKTMWAAQCQRRMKKIIRGIGWQRVTANLVPVNR